MYECTEKKEVEYPDVKPGDTVRRISLGCAGDGDVYLVVDGTFFSLGFNPLINLKTGGIWSVDSTFGFSIATRWEKINCCFKEVD